MRVIPARAAASFLLFLFKLGMTEAMEQKSPKDMKFLIVDDMNNMRRSIRAMLKLIQYGQEFYESGNGREAWKFLTRYPGAIDFIICDYAMPYMTGTELLNRIRLNKNLRDIPFLMITAEANQEIIAEAAENDVDGYLTKPFVTASLEHKIDELLHKSFHPDPFVQHLRASRDFEEKGDLKNAIREAKMALKKNQRSSRPYRELGRLFFQAGNIKDSLTCFQKAVKINRLDVSSYHYLGQIYFKQDKLDKAILFFAKAMEISPRDSDRAIKFARLLIKKRKKKEAEKTLRLVLKNNSDNEEIKDAIVKLAMEHRLHDLAVKCLRSMLKSKPNSKTLHKKLGMVLRKKGLFNEAALELEQAVKDNSNDIELILALARVYLDMDMMIRADKWATLARRIAPDNEEAKTIMARCV